MILVTIKECHSCGNEVEEGKDCPVCKPKDENRDYDSRPETRDHIHRVGDFLIIAIGNLRNRMNAHDASKLIEPELSIHSQ